MNIRKKFMTVTRSHSPQTPLPRDLHHTQWNTVHTTAERAQCRMQAFLFTPCTCGVAVRGVGGGGGEHRHRVGVDMSACGSGGRCCA